ncbi:filamentous hemagglutinin N-terminal domain-containing protein [Morganella psychrotolerans]|uniref:Filamentous hemagglutinin N-terminal domain-containing protein n=1 Tax=Morganella psychrotolerans TaxID=368603 RepID=A0A5M9R7F2_9GAMM|nr:filamentous hemagglutinin N-terminal domain-containing protein [Morganella psychrotolerans]KAA8716884.1 filamentous hemagglutinin N-terminal domain-containing protein [Morganella psychrotolerans]
MKLTKIATALLFLAPAYLSAATQDFTYRNGYKITVDQTSPDVSIQIKNNKPTQSISTPNSNGISHNYFSEFNVGKRGLNIDNAPSARVIINEVTGSNISHLDGKMAVMGKQASLIIANPNGINCNNCGVSNVSHLTLLAGNTAPDVATGKLTGFKNISGDVLVNNVKSKDIQSNLTITAVSADIRNAYIDAPMTTLNIGAEKIDFSDKITSQIAEQKLDRGHLINEAKTYSASGIDEDTKIKGNLTVNATNSSFSNDGVITGNTVNLNLLHSEFMNDGYIKASTINVNAKGGSISNSNTLFAKQLSGTYNGDFSLSNNVAMAGKSTFSVGTLTLTSNNINNLIDLNNSEYQGVYRDNTLTIDNESSFYVSSFNINGSHDTINIKNKKIMGAGLVNINGGSVRLHNEDLLAVKAGSTVHGILGTFGNGINHENITATTHDFNM